jgi:hypothetical protein
MRALNVVCLAKLNESVSEKHDATKKTMRMRAAVKVQERTVFEYSLSTRTTIFVPAIEERATPRIFWVDERQANGQERASTNHDKQLNESGS